MQRAGRAPGLRVWPTRARREGAVAWAVGVGEGVEGRTATPVTVIGGRGVCDDGRRCDGCAEAQAQRRSGSTWGAARDDVSGASGALQHIS